MVSTFHKSFRADDRSYFSLIKKDVHAIAAAAGFDQVKVGKVDLVVAEITSNLNKYADGGELLAGIGSDNNGEYIEIISIDNGPGIADVNRVLTDGYSSTATLGHGLGSIRRLSDLFDLYSLRDWGTILFSRIYRNELPAYRKKSFDCQGLNVAKTGEQFSGDGFCMLPTPNGVKILVADGLGHGPEAHTAVQKACEAFTACNEDNASETIRFIHNQIRKTRGCVGLIVFYDAAARRWSLSGVGNISARWIGPINTRNYVAYNGIIGYNIPNSINDQIYSQEEFSQFIACSDGIRSRWDLAKFPTIQQHHGMIIATALYKEFNRGTDDVSVVVCKSVQT